MYNIYFDDGDERDSYRFPFNIPFPSSDDGFASYVLANKNQNKQAFADIELQRKMGRVSGGIGLAASTIATGASVATGNVYGAVQGGLSMGGSVSALIQNEVNADNAKARLQSSIKDARNTLPSYNGGSEDVTGLRSDRVVMFEVHKPIGELMDGFNTYHKRFGYESNKLHTLTQDLFQSRERFNFIKGKGFGDTLKQLNDETIPTLIIEEYNLLFSVGMRI